VTVEYPAHAGNGPVYEAHVELDNRCSVAVWWWGVTRYATWSVRRDASDLVTRGAGAVNVHDDHIHVSCDYGELPFEAAVVVQELGRAWWRKHGAAIRAGGIL